MGTPMFAVPILKSLYQNGYSISVIYTQPPQKSKRGQKINKSPIQGVAETLNIGFRTPSLLKNNKDEYDYLKNLNADLAIIVAYGQIIPKEFLDLTKKGFLNIHASLLPEWRGAAPIQRSIMSRDKVTGISFMKIGEKLDTGPVCKKYEVEIDFNDNYETLSQKLSTLASQKISENIDDILEDKLKFIEQSHKDATYAYKIKKSEGEIEWNDIAENIIGKINGLFPNPGAWFKFKGERYKILKAEIGSGTGKIGEVLNDYLEVSCKDNKSVKILELQREGKRPQKINEFILGSLIKRGSNLKDV